MPFAYLAGSTNPSKIGLVFSRIYPFEPVKNQDITKFIEADPRWNLEEA